MIAVLSRPTPRAFEITSRCNIKKYRPRYVATVRFHCGKSSVVTFYNRVNEWGNKFLNNVGIGIHNNPFNEGCPFIARS